MVAINVFAIIFPPRSETDKRADGGENITPIISEVREDH